MQSLYMNNMPRHTPTQHDDNAALCEADVACLSHLRVLEDEEGIMASPPCQPFSALGHAGGLDEKVACAWDSMFKAARLTQRRFILVENVPGLLKHRDFAKIVNAMAWSGFRLIKQMMCDAAGIGCAARPRVILLFWNPADSPTDCAK